MKIPNRLALLAGISLAAVAAPAAAQVAGNDVDPGEDESQESAAGAARDEIIVTATRREERLQDVPIAVSVVSGDQLAEAGFSRLTDIQYQFSGVQFGTSPNDSGFRLRGVGSAGGFTSSSEQNVATVVDNVVIPFGNPVNSLGDIERVEVLKGPQGTQFGKNASSGVVNITTARPDPAIVSGHASFSYAELNEVQANAGVNLPVGESSALAVYGFYNEYDGFIENIVRDEMWGGQKTYGGRAKFLVEPSDTVEVLVAADYSKIKREGPGQLWTINRLPSFANPLMAVRFGDALQRGIVPGFDNEQSAEEYPGYSSEENYGASLQVTVGLGDLDLTSITAYRRLDEGPQRFAIDAVAFPVFTAQPTGIDQNFYSQELRLSSVADSRLEFTGGLYASRRETGDDNDFNRAQLRPAIPFDSFIVNISAGQSNTQTRSDSIAAFLDGKFHVSDSFAVIGGARIQYDTVDSQFSTIIDPDYPPGPGPNGFVVPYAPADLITGSTNKTGWSGRAGLEFNPSSDLLFFGTVARGYLGPTVTFSGLTGEKSAVAPQTVVDITLGMKGQFFDRALTFNANVFRDKYNDLQTSVFNGLEFVTENAGGFRAQGFEFDTAWRVSREFALTGSFTFSDTKFTDYVTACPNVVKEGQSCFAAEDGTTLLYQARGEPLSGAPKYSATLGADIRLPISSTLDFDYSANAYYRSGVQYAVGDRFARQGGYMTLGLNVGIGASDGGWRIGVFARNLMDEKFQSAIIGLPFADDGAYVNWMTREGRRTLGAKLDARF